MAIHWGFSYGHHDAAGVILYDGKILFAQRASAFSGIPNDSNIPPSMIERMMVCGMPDRVFVHENKRRDFWRKVKSGDWKRMLSSSPSFPVAPTSGNHHLSHAAAGYYTSGFDEALVIVADAIGECESLAVYAASRGKLHTTPLYVLDYPHSLGLFFSHHAARCGYKPNGEESLFMELSRQSWIIDEPTVMETISVDGHLFRTTKNLHRYPSELIVDPQQRAAIASTVQHVLSSVLERTYQWYRPYVQTKNLVFCGGVAYNTIAVNRLRAAGATVYVPSDPGDAGSAYGAILQHTHQHITLPVNKMFSAMFF